MTGADRFGAPVHGAADPSTLAFLDRFVHWGANATVEGYVELFDDEATLWDAPMVEGLRKVEIGPAIAQTLTLAPDFRFEPIRIGVEGPHAFVEARNSATAGGTTALSWVAVYCVETRGERVLRGRRSYDQFELQGALVAGVAHPLARGGSAEPGALGLEAPGVAGTLAGPAIASYLADLHALATVDLAPGVTVGDDEVRFVEWVGTATRSSDGRSLPFRMVERVAGHSWRLSFDAWHLVV